LFALSVEEPRYPFKFQASESQELFAERRMSSEECLL
jgi:hypothetical protein